MQRVRGVFGALGLALLLAGCGHAVSTIHPESDPVTSSGGESESSGQHSDNPTSGRHGPLRSGSPAASCVEQYAPDAIADRSFAFDGTVLRIGPSASDRGDTADLDNLGVTFEVHEWFAGGDAGTVVVDMPPATTGSFSASDGHSYGVGSRLLVSGEPRWGGGSLDSPIAWPCGFSRYYDATTAGAWREAVRP